MLDVHPAEHAAKNWKEFFIHIATIVIGLLIAVGLEQTVEALHRRHQLHNLEQALRTSGEANKEYIDDNITMVQGVMDWAMAQAVALEHAGPTGSLTLSRMPAAELYAPDTGVWLTAKANGQAGLLSPGERNWLEDLDVLESQIYVSNASAVGQLKNAYAALDLAIAGHATETPSGDLDLSTLNPTQRSTVIERLRSIVEQTRRVMSDLVSYNVENEYILTTPHDELDDPQALKRFNAIARKNAEAHPGLRYAFSAK
jgi:type II secretory pathway pseudopilin PulG